MAVAAMFAVVGTGVQAQGNYDTGVQTRLQQLEQELKQLQRQIYRGETGYQPSAGPAGTAVPMNPGQFDVQLMQFEEQMRQMNGRIEEVEYRQRSLEDRLTRLEKDMDMRLQELERRLGEGAAAGDDMALNGTAPSSGYMKDTREPLPSETAAGPGAGTGPQPTTAGTGQLSAEPAEALSFDDPRSHYNYAFKLLNQAKFDQAGQAFESFAEAYPEDPLIGNAYYWMGETYYVRRDFLKAADTFRQGYQKMPDGPKAPDNLLKLGMSLANLGKQEEACVVYAQLQEKFADSSVSIRQKVEQERARLGCK